MKLLISVSFIIAAVFCLLSEVMAAPVSQGLTLWLEANAGVESASGVPASQGQAVAYWRDQSGNHNDFSQGNTNNRPVFTTNAIGGNPALSFNGVNQYLQRSNVAALNANSVTIFAVITGADMTGQPVQEPAIFANRGWTSGYVLERSSYDDGHLNFYNNYNGNPLPFATNSDGLPVSGFSGKIVAVEKVVNTSVTLYVDGTATQVASTGVITAPVAGGNLYVGGHVEAGLDYTSYYGTIAELLVYSRALTDQELNTTGLYLEQKYGLDTAYGPTPVPVPGAMLLLGTGMAGLAAGRSIRKKR